MDADWLQRNIKDVSPQEVMDFLLSLGYSVDYLSNEELYELADEIIGGHRLDDETEELNFD